MDIELIVTLQVEPDFKGEEFPLEDMQNTAKEAVEEALNHGSNRGFNHPLADVVSIGVCGVDIVPPSEKHTVNIHWGSYSTRRETFEENGEDCLFPYEFDTLKELNAFLLGVNEADGWLESEQVDDPEAYFEEMRKEL